KSLPCCHSITKSLRHYRPFIQAPRREDRCFMSVSFVDPMLVICTDQINLATYFYSNTVVQDLILSGEGRMVLDGVVIKSSVVMNNTRELSRIFLWSHKGSR